MSSALFTIGLLLPAFNPGWPPADLETPPSALAREEAMPDDPDYRPADDARFGCTGQLGLYSFTPACVASLAAEERELGTGVGADRAWLWTTGRPEAVLAVLDDGADWSDGDVIVKIALNAGELPVPLGSAVHDANHDGSFDVRDYTSATGTIAVTLERLLDPRIQDTNGNGLVDPQDLLRAFSDSLDSDENGFADDIAGWDFVSGDSDPGLQDRIPAMPGLLAASVAVANNQLGGAGACPGCTAIAVRVSKNGLAEGAALARAIRYARERGARLIAANVASAGDSSEVREAIRETSEANILFAVTAGFSGSPLREGPWENEAALVSGMFAFDDPQLHRATTALAPSTCGGSGADLSISTPGRCEQHAASLGITAGTLGLALSASFGIPAREIPPLDPPLSARELLRLANTTALDVARPRTGFDSETGYGRLDARALLDAIARRLIPPEVELLAPESHAMIDPTPGVGIAVTGFVVNTRSDRASYVLEWAIGRAPPSTAFSALASGTIARGETANVAGSISTASLFPDPAASPEGSTSQDFELTIRLVANGSFGGDVARSEARRVIVVHRDLELLPAFPIALGRDAIGAPRTIDLTGDGAEDIVVALDDGSIQALDVRGRTLGRFPIALPGDPSVLATLAAGPLHTSMKDVVLGVRTAEGRAMLVDQNGGVLFDRPTEAGPNGAVLEDLDGDGTRELITAEGGKIYAFRSTGELLAGYPVDLSESTGTPATGDLDRDGFTDIAVASRNNLFVLHGKNGELFSGWPAGLPFSEEELELGSEALARPAVSLGDADGDDRLDIAVAARGRGVAVFDVEGRSLLVTALFGKGEELALADLDSDGTLDAARASRGEIQLSSLTNGTPIDTNPLLIQGTARGGVAVADLDGDGRKEVIFDGGDGTLDARNLDGTTPRFWPKVIGDSLAGAAQLGDLDGDGLLEVVAITRAGRVFAWRTPAATTDVSWSGARHDSRGTGNTDTPIAVLTDLEVEAGCGCAAASRSSASTAFGALLLLAVHRLLRGAGAKRR
jgi:hypothetical protein